MIAFHAINIYNWRFLCETPSITMMYCLKIPKVIWVVLVVGEGGVQDRFISRGPRSDSRQDDCDKTVVRL